MYRLFRSAAMAVAIAFISIVAVPSYAGDKEVAYLNRLVGTWTGGGKLTGEYKASLTCKVVFKPSGAKVNFSGRCTLTDLPSQNISGSLSYNDDKKQYEVRSGGKTVVGKRSGNTLTFVLVSRSIQGKSTTTMALSPTSIIADATLTDNESKTSRTHMSLKKS
jgi:hypothetical protein